MHYSGLKVIVKFHVRLCWKIILVVWRDDYFKFLGSTFLLLAQKKSCKRKGHLAGALGPRNISVETFRELVSPTVFASGKCVGGGAVILDGSNFRGV